MFIAQPPPIVPASVSLRVSDNVQGFSLPFHECRHICCPAWKWLSLFELLTEPPTKLPTVASVRGFLMPFYIEDLSVGPQLPCPSARRFVCCTAASPARCVASPRLDVTSCIHVTTTLLPQLLTLCQRLNCQRNGLPQLASLQPSLLDFQRNSRLALLRGPPTRVDNVLVGCTLYSCGVILC